ncbi:MAG: lipocalin-like domain-containing protein [Burkholderiales bacterium]|jgi:predicted secreted hydrolase
MRTRLLAGLFRLALLYCASALPPASYADNPGASASIDYPPVISGRKLVFPADHGAHPEFRTEWWYVTGWIDSNGVERGFQVTFFRSRPGVQEDNDSDFAPKQLIFAHAAIADARHGRLIYDQRAAREGFGLAYASTGDTDVAIDDWNLVRNGNEYHARIAADNFTLDLQFVPSQPVLLQGRNGFSTKGPEPGQASYYYSVPQLQVSGSVMLDGRTQAVHGQAWLDHEWSSQYLPQQAQGWDWISLNLADGAALMAFRMRSRSGGVLWAGGSVRDASGRLRVLAPDEVTFEPLRQWHSPRTGFHYPVAMRIRAGDYRFDIEPLMDDQELDSRPSTGIVYWEGAVRAHSKNAPSGRGYLELTGYGEAPAM